ncbi:MAG: helix-turn-helix domain-containing protein [Chloroflexi bacterium]|nr:helix-turn-helix domain-containing protein [Chloroflexota bacterium]
MGHIGTVVMRAREERGWSQDELGKRLGWSTEAVKRLESGQALFPALEHDIERVFGAPIAELTKHYSPGPRRLGPPRNVGDKRAEEYLREKQATPEERTRFYAALSRVGKRGPAALDRRVFDELWNTPRTPTEAWKYCSRCHQPRPLSQRICCDMGL